MCDFSMYVWYHCHWPHSHHPNFLTGSGRIPWPVRIGGTCPPCAIRYATGYRPYIDIFNDRTVASVWTVLYIHCVAAVPDLSLDLATTNYLGDALQWTLIRQDVSRVIMATTYPTNASLITTTEPVQFYYGIQVCQFILDECHELGLWTGQYPDNCRLSHFRDRCNLMWIDDVNNSMIVILQPPTRTLQQHYNLQSSAIVCDAAVLWQNGWNNFKLGSCCFHWQLEVAQLKDSQFTSVL